MIESHPDNETNASAKPVAPLPSVGAKPAATVLPAPPPTAPKKSPNKAALVGFFVFLFICALLGGYFAYQTINKSSKLDITQSEKTLAWRPVSVTGTCSGGRVIGNNESVPYTFDFTFILANGDRSATLQHTFSSAPTGSTNKIDADFTWESFGSEGANFASLLRTNDRVTWRVTVNYTGGSENHEGFFNIFDTACNTGSSPSPSATTSPSPSATVTASPTASATATATASPTASPTRSASPSPTATSSPAIGGEPTPTPTPTPTSTPNPTATATNSPVAQATTTPTNPPTSVANSSDQLPKAGVEEQSWLLIAIGFVSLTLSAVFAFSRRKIA